MPTQRFFLDKRFDPRLLKLASHMKAGRQEYSMSNPQSTARVIGRILIGALEAATTAANGDEEAQRFVQDLRDELKPDLDWMMRYNRFFDIPEDPQEEDPTFGW